MKILVFAPHAALWVHAFPEALVADALASETHEILYVSCDRVFQESCVPMSAYGLNSKSSQSERSEVCDQCRDKYAILKKHFQFHDIMLSSLIMNSERQWVETVLALPQEQLIGYEADGISVGKLAAYELMMKTKKVQLNFSPEEWQQYKTAFRNTLLTYVAARRVLRKERPDRLLVYNSLYSVNHTFVQAARKRNIPAYFLHAYENIYDRLNRIIVAKDNTFAYFKALAEHWQTIRKTPCTETEIKNVSRHFLTLFSGEHFLAYSSAAGGGLSIRDYFKIPQSSSVIVATLSSYDEIVSLEMVGVLKRSDSILFADQIAWIRAVVEYISNHPYLFLIIRVHPREFPNKRDPVRSDHSRRLEQVFSDLPGNAVVNWPTDNLSIYDIAKEADIFLNAWSSAGEEMTLLGFPVVLYSDELIFYPAGVNYLANSQEDYFQTIEKTLKLGWQPENIIRGFRWYAIKFLGATFTVSDTFGYRENPPLLKIGKFPQLVSRLNRKLQRLFPKLSKLLPLRFRYYYEFQDLKRESNRIEAAKLSEMLQNNFKTSLEVSQKSRNCLSEQDEKRLIAREMKLLLSRLFGENDVAGRASPLFRRLSQWVENET